MWALGTFSLSSNVKMGAECAARMLALPTRSRAQTEVTAPFGCGRCFVVNCVTLLRLRSWQDAVPVKPVQHVARLQDQQQCARSKLQCGSKLRCGVKQHEEGKNDEAC